MQTGPIVRRRLSLVSALSAIASEKRRIIKPTLSQGLSGASRIHSLLPRRRCRKSEGEKNLEDAARRECVAAVLNILQIYSIIEIPIALFDGGDSKSGIILINTRARSRDPKSILRRRPWLSGSLRGLRTANGDYIGFFRASVKRIAYSQRLSNGPSDGNNLYN